jgi:hypothetical protein
MRAPQQTLNERIADGMYALLKPPPCDLNHRGVVAEPILDYEIRARGMQSGDVRKELISIVTMVAAFNPMTAPKTERKKIAALEQDIRRMRLDIGDLADPSPYQSLLSELGRTRAVSSAPVASGRKEWLRLKLTVDRVLDLMIEWGFTNPASLHNRSQFVRLTAKVFEIATGTKRGLPTAKRACTEYLNDQGLARSSDIERMLKKFRKTPPPLSETILPEFRALNRTDMEHWVPLDQLLADKKAGASRPPA